MNLWPQCGIPVVRGNNGAVFRHSLVDKPKRHAYVVAKHHDAVVRQVQAHESHAYVVAKHHDAVVRQVQAHESLVPMRRFQSFCFIEWAEWRAKMRSNAHHGTHSCWEL
jgi:CO dehydrogenase/acetyl-CoA synthase alpha subunit